MEKEKLSEVTPLTEISFTVDVFWGMDSHYFSGETDADGWPTPQ